MGPLVPVVLVEAGIFRGESLAVWTDVLPPSATVIGVDGNVSPFAHALPKLYQRGAFRSGTPRVIQGTSVQAAARIANASVTLFIDDAGHSPRAQIDTFGAWRGKMRWGDEATYIIEDIINMPLVRGTLARLDPALHFCSHGYLAILYARAVPINDCANWCVRNCAKSTRCGHCERRH